MRILWLKTELLHPVDKGGRIRTYQMLRQLKNEHEITYLALHDGGPESDSVRLAREYADEVVTVPHATTTKFTKAFYLELAKNVASPLPYFMQKYHSPRMRAEILRCLESRKFDVVVCDFLMPAINLPDHIKVPKLLFQHNVEAQIWKRHYEVESNPIKKAYLRGQWKKTFEYERATCRKFDMVVAVSNEDADQMTQDYGLSNVKAIPTGVDTEYFTPANTVDKSGFNIVFTGSMDWLPNEDAMRWFVSSIYPAIKQQVPQVSLTVVGRNPPAGLVEECKTDPSIKFTGRVDDVRPFMGEASVYVVPIRVGGGTRLKIYEAMSMGLPIVSTTIGAEGLSYTDGKDIVIKDDESGFAEGVTELLKNDRLAKQIGATAEARAKADLGWRNVAKLFSEHCMQITAPTAQSVSEPVVAAHQAA